MCVQVTKSGDKLNFGPPEPLFSFKPGGPTGRNRYVVAPDGTSFIFITPRDAYSEPGVTVVLNWPSLLAK